MDLDEAIVVVPWDSVEVVVLLLNFVCNEEEIALADVEVAESLDSADFDLVMMESSAAVKNVDWLLAVLFK